MAVHLNKLVANQSGVLVEQNELMVDQNKEVVKQSKTMIKQNKLSEARNSSLAFLTGVTTLLLPFTTIAAYMAIPPDSGLGPGSKDQWIYWISAGLLATFLVFALLISVGRSGMLIMRGKLITESFHGCFHREGRRKVIVRHNLLLA